MSTIDLSKMKSPAMWPGMRQNVVQAVSEVVGPINRDKLDLQLKTVDEQEFRGYVRKRVNYFVDSWDRISAWLFVPEGKEEAPAIVCCHSQTASGKNEPAGEPTNDSDSRLAFAQRYAEMGFITLAPDCLTAGDRCSSKMKPYDTRNFYKDNPKGSLAAKFLSDHCRAVDALCEVKRVDPARIGVIGHGMGGMNALLLAAFDERVAACVASEAFTRFATDKDPQRWFPEEGPVLLPRLKEFVDSGKYPFDWEHILALAAPTPLLLLYTLSNSPFSTPKSGEKAVTLASKVYKLLGAPGAIDHFGHHDGERVSAETMEVADEWFERWL